MLPDSTVPASLLTVLKLVRGSFTAPTFRTFAALVTGTDRADRAVHGDRDARRRGVDARVVP